MKQTSDHRSGAFLGLLILSLVGPGVFGCDGDRPQRAEPSRMGPGPGAGGGGIGVVDGGSANDAPAQPARDAGANADGSSPGDSGGDDISGADGADGAALCTPTGVADGPPMIREILQGCPGRTLIITGAHLNGAGTCVVVGGVVLPAERTPSGDLGVAVPASFPTGAAPVEVTTTQGTAGATAQITMVPPPQPTAVVPAQASPGATVRIMGTDLNWVSSLTLAGQANGADRASPAIAFQSSTTLTFLVPTLPAGAYTATVVNPCGSAALMNFIITN